MKMRFKMNSETLICIWILVFLVGITEVLTPRKWGFWLYISSIHDYLYPNTRNSLVNNSWNEMEPMWKTCLSAPLNAKKWHQLKHKNEVRNWYFCGLVLRLWKIILVISGWAHKRQTVTQILLKKKIWKFLFTFNRLFKHKEFVSNSMFVLMT